MTETTYATIDLGHGTEMVFCRVPSGSFLMGSRGVYANEEPVHQVSISNAFWLGQTPVTQAQYALFNSEHKNHFADRPNNPVESISWDDAAKYCEWFTSKFSDQFPADMQLACLPSEAQWEYACRARLLVETHAAACHDAWEYSNGDGATALSRIAHFGQPWDSGSTAPTNDSRPGNHWGLRDMHGNVWEWCQDPWDEAAYRRRWDGIDERNTLEMALEHGAPSVRVMRGGSWSVTAFWCRSTWPLRVPGRSSRSERRSAGLPGSQPRAKRGQAHGGAGERRRVAEGRGGAGKRDGEAVEI